MLNRVKKALTRKIGPIPAWGWLAALAAALFLYQRHRAATGAGASSTVNVPPTDAQLAPTGYTATNEDGGDAGGASGDTPPPMPTPLVYDPTTDTYNPPPDGAGGGTRTEPGPLPTHGPTLPGFGEINAGGGEKGLRRPRAVLAVSTVSGIGQKIGPGGLGRPRPTKKKPTKHTHHAARHAHHGEHHAKPSTTTRHGAAKPRAAHGGRTASRSRKPPHAAKTRTEHASHSHYAAHPAAKKHTAAKPAKTKAKLRERRRR